MWKIFFLTPPCFTKFGNIKYQFPSQNNVIIYIVVPIAFLTSVIPFRLLIRRFNVRSNETTKLLYIFWTGLLGYNHFVQPLWNNRRILDRHISPDRDIPKNDSMVCAIDFASRPHTLTNLTMRKYHTPIELCISRNVNCFV